MTQTASTDEHVVEDDVMRRVRRATLDVPGTKKTIADFLVREGSGVANLSMAEVADLTFTSKPTLVRFAKAMGFAGWRDFRMAFVTATRSSEESLVSPVDVDPNHPFGPDDDLGAIVQNVLALEQQALRNVASHITDEILQEAAQRVLRAHCTVFLGEEPNVFFGKLFAYKLSHIGVGCHIPAREQCSMIARGLGPKDCAIIASYSGNGEHREPASFVTQLNEAGVPIVAITNSGSNWLKEHCDCVIAFEPREHYYGKISGYFSEQCVHFALDLLFSAIFVAHYEQNEIRKLRALIAYERAHQQTLVDVLPY